MVDIIATFRRECYEYCRSSLKTTGSKVIHVPAHLQKYKLISKALYSLLRRYNRLFNTRFLVQKRMGAFFLLDQINAVDRHLLVRGVWEAPQVAFLSQLIVANRRAGEPLVLLDIGSHAAFYPIVLSQSIAFDRIVAYEPVPVNLAQLRANLMLNGMLSEVEVVEKAVSNGEAKLEFIIGYDNNRGLSRIMDGTKKEKEKVIEVVATTIDGSSSYENSLIVCKIDVEGGEMKVIEGMMETIARNRFILQIENVATRPISQLKELLESQGCKMVHSIAYDHYFIKA